MGSRLLVFGVVVVLATACGDGGDADDGPGIELGTDVPRTADTSPGDSVMPDDPPPATSAGSDGNGDSGATDPTDPSADPSSTLELNPPKTTAPLPSTTAGDPVGFPEALFPGQRDPGLDPLVDQASTDLATRLGVDPDTITTVSATLVTWPDSAMGCPQPGMEYLQALQDGSLIELEHDGRVFRYHTGGSRSVPFLCDQPTALPPTAGGGATD